MSDVYNIKINKIKFFFNKKNYYGMNRKDYLHRLMQENPQDYKKYIITEYSDEIIVYTTWYLLLLILSAILIIFSIFIYSYWYIFLGLSIITLISSKIIQNKLSKMLSSIKILFKIIDIMIKKNN